MEDWQDAGYVDENFQPLVSRTQAALLANVMAKTLKIQKKWKVFETLYIFAYKNSLWSYRNWIPSL